MNNLKSFIVILLTFTASLASVDELYTDNAENEGDPDLEAYLREAIENFREQMTKGIPGIKMPVLDPLKLDNLNIDVFENLATVNLFIKEMEVSCLANFSVVDLKADLEEFFLHINLSLPVIFVNGQYKLDGKFLRVFPIYGSGNFSINATSIIIGGTGHLRFTEDTLQMDTLNLDLWWEHLILDFENFLNGTRFSEVLLKAIPGAGRDVFNRYKNKILGLLDEFLLKKINEKLQKPEVKDIIRGILPES